MGRLGAIFREASVSLRARYSALRRCIAECTKRPTPVSPCLLPLRSGREKFAQEPIHCKLRLTLQLRWCGVNDCARPLATSCAQNFGRDRRLAAVAVDRSAIRHDNLPQVYRKTGSKLRHAGDLRNWIKGHCSKVHCPKTRCARATTVRYAQLSTRDDVLIRFPCWRHAFRLAGARLGDARDEVKPAVRPPYKEAGYRESLSSRLGKGSIRSVERNKRPRPRRRRQQHRRLPLRRGLPVDNHRDRHRHDKRRRDEHRRDRRRRGHRLDKRRRQLKSSPCTRSR
jgi:hypothetical protein